MTADVTASMTIHPGHAMDERPCASYTLRVNGFERPVTDAWIGESLLYVLRERLGLAGAKNGCEQGECGACSVQVDGQLVAGCLVPAALAADSEISTVEGLSAGGAASDVQQALAESGAVQCGYCTPGMAMAVHDLLQRNHRPSEVEARQALCGNLCRCTGYRSVLAAVGTVADARSAALLEAEEEAAEAQEAGADAAPASEAAPEPEPEAPDLPLYQDAWIEAAPVAEEPWITAQTPQPQPTAAGAGIGAGMIPAQQGHLGYDPTAYGPGTVYDAGASYEPTPTHGTPYDPAMYEQTVYESAPVTPAPFDPYAAGYGIPAPAASFDGTVYETGTPSPYDGAPAHGQRLPEDDHA